MRVCIFTQDERVFLPAAIARVVEAMPDQIACICLSPPMSTHGGTGKGLWKHVGVFGVRGTAFMAGRILLARIASTLRLPAPAERRFWSIAQIGRTYGIPTFHVAKVNTDEMLAILDRHPADLLVSVSCPQIIRKPVLDRFSKGGINVHSAPLPRYRGLMPAFWVLYHGETETAVTVHRLADKLDNGSILLQRAVRIEAGETWNSLVKKTKAAAGDALVEAIHTIGTGPVEELPNRDEESTYFSFPSWDQAREFRARGHRMF